MKTITFLIPTRITISKGCVSVVRHYQLLPSSVICRICCVLHQGAEALLCFSVLWHQTVELEFGLIGDRQRDLLHVVGFIGCGSPKSS